MTNSVSGKRKAALAAETAAIVESAIAEIKSTDPEVRALAEEIIRGLGEADDYIGHVLHDLNPEDLARGIIKHRTKTGVRVTAGSGPVTVTGCTITHNNWCKTHGTRHGIWIEK